MTWDELRAQFHHEIITQIVRKSHPVKAGLEYYNFADGDNLASICIANKIVEAIGIQVPAGRVQNAPGTVFESVCKHYLQECFTLLGHIRPGDWEYSTSSIDVFEQYRHLADLTRELKKIRHTNQELARTLKHVFGSDYVIKPDIVISRRPLTDTAINRRGRILNRETQSAQRTPLRVVNQRHSIMHASISCKWTIRSDRAQNTRTEALNLIRHRKGRVPHIVAITAEPLPTRLASLALGTGDLDCVYHVALPELIQAIDDLRNVDQQDMLSTLTSGRRLRDISDLAFDLAV